ncbi:hypothetical protein [Streptomyces sp. NPDC001652]|uniref:hypothetical protein n=1 Tax=Streptomyces sp. NPDC001652 TaxID=3154393 RepID=UPI0033343C22
MIQAIETRYASCRFRSRLEARWAVFFDSLGVTWEYEPQGILVGDARRPYLPDFKVHRPWTDQPMWVEVKGTDEALDLDLLAAAVGDDGLDGPIMLLGPVPAPTPPPLHAFLRNIFGVPCMVKGLLGPGLGAVQIGREHALGTPSPYENPISGPAAGSGPWVMTEILDHPRVSEAYTAARSARFEHGESGS